ncbi:hypothetical protein F1C58_08390 [Glaciihabitans sp. INWT7]|uniref:hypothetical protein n=1 Tax=Glaciihabitans sp. INWT7 TaxID=2596912 RepID=UPI001626E52A|nr:hypothetical protein [Glaciihabitans sp. INWT7]QNE46919.1 hypothetical protein F1C58_08390 [Glaciihabitans sp. INWT7]
MVRLAEAEDARQFQQVASGIAALSRAYRDLQGLGGPPGGGEEAAKEGLKVFFELTRSIAAGQRGATVAGAVVVSDGG